MGKIQSSLELEDISSCAKLSPSQLSHVVTHCPYVRRLRFKYLPTEVEAEAQEGQGHLSVLSDLGDLRGLHLTDCDFYGHHLFTLVGMR